MMYAIKMMIAIRKSFFLLVLCCSSCRAFSTISSPSDTATLTGITSLKGGDIDSAISHFQEAINLDESNSEAYLHLGLSYKRQKNLAQASIVFRRASELIEIQNDAPKNYNDARYELGMVLSEMGYVDEAVGLFQELVTLEDEEPSQQSPPSANENSNRRPSKAKIQLANVLLDGCGKKSEAFTTFRQCCTYCEQSPMSLLAGITLDSMKNHLEAEEHYTKSVANTEKLEEVVSELALYLMLSKIRQGEKSDDVAILRGRLLDYVRSSTDYILSTPLKKTLPPSLYYFTYDMIQLALQSTQQTMKERGGLILEFGVYHGKTIRMIASHFTQEAIHGFDTFTGIPEDWHSTPSGSYSTHGTVPSAPNNVEYHVGLFSDTLSGFLDQHEGAPVQFMNIDYDLYSSTKDVLDVIHDRIVEGTVIVFDEYVMNPNWEKDEYKAFQEAVQEYGWEYEYIAISVITGQAIVRITKA